MKTLPAFRCFLALCLLPFTAAMAQPAAAQEQQPASKQVKPADPPKDEPKPDEPKPDEPKPENLDPYPRNPEFKPGAVQYRRYWFADADKYMEYAVYFPKSFKPDDKEKKYPTIFALHGLGSSASGILHYPGFSKLAEEHGYILVAPSGHGRAGWYGSRGYRMLFSVPRNLGELSEKDVLNVIKLARRDFPLDEKRLYLLGHSMGGGGTFHIAIKDPSPWAALAPIAPAFYRDPEELEKIKDLPVVMVQGDKDRLVPVQRVRKLAEKMKELEMTHEYIEIEGGDHVIIAFENLPRIFKFFNTHKK